VKVFLIMVVMGTIFACSSQKKYQTTGINKRQVHQRFSSEKTDQKRQKELEKGKVYYMVCSYYGLKFHGKQTSNGEIFDMYKFTCAHKYLPFNTVLRVTNEDNGCSVVVRVNDRGPFIEGRDLDLSYAAALQINLIGEGVKILKVEIIR